mgnify:CR=1 FL=1
MQDYPPGGSSFSPHKPHRSLFERLTALISPEPENRTELLEILHDAHERNLRFGFDTHRAVSTTVQRTTRPLRRAACQSRVKFIFRRTAPVPCPGHARPSGVTPGCMSEPALQARPFAAFASTSMGLGHMFGMITLFTWSFSVNEGLAGTSSRPSSSTRASTFLAKNPIG